MERETTSTNTVVEGHSDLMLDVCYRRSRGERSVITQVHLPRLRRGGVGIQFLTVGGDAQSVVGDRSPEPSFEALLLLDMVWQEVAESKGAMLPIRDVDELSRCSRTGQLGLVLHFEGARPIRAEPALLRTFFRLGVRSIGLTWNQGNELSDGCMNMRGAGLTRAGVMMMREMQALGMLVDVAHLSSAGIADVLRIAESPIIASHCNARAICDHPRNLTDSELAGIASLGGVVGVCFYPAFVTREKRRPDIADVVSHVEHIASVVGSSHVGVGPDFTDIMPAEWTAIPANRGIADDLRRQFPKRLANVSELQNLQRALLDRGWSETDVAGVMGNNFYRILRQILPAA